MKRTLIIAPLITFAICLAILSFVYSMEEERHREKQRLYVYHTLTNVKTRLEAAAQSKRTWLEALCAQASGLGKVTPAILRSMTESMPQDLTGARNIEIFHNHQLFWAWPSRLTNLVGLDDATLLPQEFIEKSRLLPALSKTLITPPISMENTRQSLAFISPIHTGRPASADTYWGYALLLVDSGFFLRQGGVLDTYNDIRIAVRELNEERGFIFGSPGLFNNQAIRLDAHMPGSLWELAAMPRNGWRPSPYGNQVWILGLLMTMVATFAAWLIAHQFLMRVQEREEYSHLVHNARTIIIRFDTGGRITFINEYGLAFFGYEKEELIGQLLIDTILPSHDLNGTDMRRMLSRMMDSPSQHLFNENENMLKNGDRVWIAWSNKAITNRRNRVVEFLSVGTDITERRHFEEALRESEEKHRMLAENVTDVIWGLDANLHFTYISPSDRQLRGYPRDEVLGKPLWDFVAPGSRQTLLDTVAELDQAELDGSHPKSTTMILEMLCHDGSTVWVEALCTILYNETGKLVGMQGVCRDITDRIRIQALREDVERMARHDLKTPLSAVIGLPQEIMNDDNLNDRQREMLSVIAKAGASMLELVNRSLDLHKMETGTYELDAQVINICALIEQIMAEIRPLAAKKSLSFALDTGDSDCMISGEGVLLHSMLSNLLKNAIEAAPEESAISIAIKHAGQWRRIVIRNKGSVPLPLRDTFFDKYSRSKTSKGSGLGTYSARLVARTHGGDISLDTTRPDETTLIVSLPPI